MHTCQASWPFHLLADGVAALVGLECRSEISPDGRSIPDLMSKASLEDLKNYIDIIGPGKGLLVRRVAGTNDTSSAQHPMVQYQSTQLAEMLHARGFQVRQHASRLSKAILMSMRVH